MKKEYLENEHWETLGLLLIAIVYNFLTIQPMNI